MSIRFLTFISLGVALAVAGCGDDDGPGTDAGIIDMDVGPGADGGPTAGELPPAQAARLGAQLLGRKRRELYELALSFSGPH